MLEQAKRRADLGALIVEKGALLINPPMLLAANPFFDLAGEELGRRLLLTTGNNDVEYCLRPEFTLPIAKEFLLAKEKNQHGAAFGYLGPIFRQRAEGPVEFTQLGLEILGKADADAALEKVFDFAIKAIEIYDFKPKIRLGSVAIFEALLANVDIPDVWRPRIRHRFGQPEAMARLLERLADPHGTKAGAIPWKKDELILAISDQMLAASLSLTGSRSPEEIANRYFEKQELAASNVPEKTLKTLKQYLAVKGDALAMLNLVEKSAFDYGLDISAPIKRLITHVKLLQQKHNIKDIEFDASFSPRLDYYTGIVFQMIITGNVAASGGEYDRLLQRLGSDKPLNASGCSIWIDRLEEEKAK